MAAVSTTETDLTKYAISIQQLYAGRSNATGSVTLTPSVGSTAVSAVNCAPQSAILIFAKTAHAAAELAAGGCYVSAVGVQTFTITHANNAQADRSFFWVALG